MVRTRTQWMATVAATMLSMMTATASERYFTYTYEPETMPKGATEFEQWVTLRTQRSRDVGQENYNRWELREELEYGVTDNYTAAFYVNLMQATNYKDPATGDTVSETEFKGVSLENRYMLLNPAENPVGLTLYFEPSYSGDEAEIEEKIIIGQRHGDWKWALNLANETEWDLNGGGSEGVFEVDFGLTRHLNPRWSLGVEFRNHNVIPSYDEWEFTAFFLGPVLNYSAEKWWVTLTVLPQIWGKNTGGGPQPVDNFELEDHERVNIRMIFGVGF